MNATAEKIVWLETGASYTPLAAVSQREGNLNVLRAQIPVKYCNVAQRGDRLSALVLSTTEQVPKLNNIFSESSRPDLSETHPVRH